MYQTSREWRCAGFLMLGGVLLSGVSAFGADDPPLSNQLTDLGRQALTQGASKTARTFFEKALALDPSNAGAARGLKEIERSQSRRRPGCDARPGSGAAAAGQPAPARHAASAAPRGRRDQGDHRADRGRRKYRPTAVDQRRRTAHPERPRTAQLRASLKPP